MASMDYEEVINAPAGDVWAFVSDFAGLDKWATPGSISHIEMEGDGIGAVRAITSTVGLIREKLEIFDSAAMRIGYSMDNDTPLPFMDYFAIAKVTELPDNRCMVNWQSTFAPVGEAEDAKKVALGLYISGLKGIRKHLDA